MFFVYSVFFISAYLAASFQEWFAHKYLMHQKSLHFLNGLYKNHLLHHKNTLDDYTIQNGNTEYICFDLFTVDGMVQTGVVLSLNVGVFFVVFYPVIPLSVITTTISVLLSINILVWNVVHSYVHGFDSSVICSPMGISNRYVSENNPVIKWLSDNHRKHHDKPNTHYNIVFPGADHLLGTAE